MSHDVLLIKPRRELNNIQEFLESDGPEPLGSAADVRVIIEGAFPGTTWDTATWGHIAAGSVTAEVSLKGETPQTVRLFCHFNSGRQRLGENGNKRFDDAIEALFNRYGWQAFSFSDGDRLRRNGHPRRDP